MCASVITPASRVYAPGSSFVILCIDKGVFFILNNLLSWNEWCVKKTKSKIARTDVTCCEPFFCKTRNMVSLFCTVQGTWSERWFPLKKTSNKFLFICAFKITFQRWWSNLWLSSSQTCHSIRWIILGLKRTCFRCATRISCTAKKKGKKEKSHWQNIGIIQLNHHS